MVNAETFYNRLLEASGYSAMELRSKLRNRDTCDKRAIISCIMKDNGYTIEEIGRVLERNRSTIYISYLSAREYVKDEIERIKNKLNER